MNCRLCEIKRIPREDGESRSPYNVCYVHKTYIKILLHRSKRRPHTTNYSQYVHASSSLTWPESSLLDFLPILCRTRLVQCHLVISIELLTQLEFIFCIFVLFDQAAIFYPTIPGRNRSYHDITRCEPYSPLHDFPPQQPIIFSICCFDNFGISLVELWALMVEWNYTYTLEQLNHKKQSFIIVMSRSSLSILSVSSDSSILFYRSIMMLYA